jgi:hypothetical protein
MTTAEQRMQEEMAELQRRFKEADLPITGEDFDHQLKQYTIEVGGEEQGVKLIAKGDSRLNALKAAMTQAKAMGIVIPD